MLFVTPSQVNASARAGVPCPARRSRLTRLAGVGHVRPASEEAAIAAQGDPTLNGASLAYSAGWIEEDEVLVTGRQRATEVGCTPIAPGGGATLRFLAAVTSARAVVELGTGTGVSGVWLLRGMRPDGVLTSVDTEGEHQRLARQTLTEAGFPAGRARLINGRAMDVLPRLSDGGYDLVFCDATKAEYADYLTHASRLLRPGGVVAFDNALWRDRVADPSQRDPETVALRELLRSMRDDDRWVPVLLPVGDGLLAAAKTG